jgi:hypothetical protein
MRGVNLDIFDFDYDCTWYAFFLRPDGTVLGRYGGRDAESAGKWLSLGGLRHAMERALARHRSESAATAPAPAKGRTAEQYPAARRLAEGACIHCHHINEFGREAELAAGTWRPDSVWVYPPPANVGLTLDPDRGDRVRAVAPGSAADRAGLRAGDRLVTVGGWPVASFGDVQYALHRAPERGTLRLTWERAGRPTRGALALAPGWRQADVSWRWSLQNFGPSPGVYGEDLGPAEKAALGLGAKQLAFRQGSFVPPLAQQAGIQQNDVIVGADGRHLELTARQFEVYVRLNYRAGDRITYNVLRDGKRRDVTLKLSR